MGTGLAKGAGITSLVGTGIAAGGAYEAGQAQKKSENYSAQLATENAAIATQNAQWVGAESNSNVEAESLKNRAQFGSILANQAASGLDVNKGSAVDVRGSQEKLQMLDTQTLRSNAARKAYGFETQAVSDTAQSQLDTAAAKNAQTAGEINAGATLLSGTGAAASNYAKYLSSNTQKNPLNTNDITGQ